MNLTLAAVLSCTEQGCDIEFLDGTRAAARYSTPVKDRIKIRPGQLVAVEVAHPDAVPEVVWRLFKGMVHEAHADGSFAVSRYDARGDELPGRGDPSTWLHGVRPVAGLAQPIAVGDEVFYSHDKVASAGRLYDRAVGGKPAEPDRVAAALFPEVEETYRAIERGEDV